MTERGVIPEVPADQRCRCVLPQEATGLNLAVGFGETRCKQCNRHIRWGCGKHSLAGPTS